MSFGNDKMIDLRTNERLILKIICLKLIFSKKYA